MNHDSAIERLVEQIARRLPPGLSTVGDEFTAAARAVLSDAFARLELVTREEFDAQTRVLARSRELISRLENELRELDARVAELEKGGR